MLDAPHLIQLELQMKILVLNNKDVGELLSIKDCISVMTDALISLSRNESHQPLRMIVRPPSAAGVMGLMPAYMSGDHAAYGLKVICIFPGNVTQGKASHQGAVLLFSATTGEPLAILNASAVTAIRTAAVSAVATKLLAREEAGILAIIGSGVQARSHLEAMSCVRTLKLVRVASRSIEHARKFAEEMSGFYSFPIEAVANVELAVRGAELIVTATTAAEPIIRRNWISPGTHLNLVGSSTPTAREIDTATMAGSSLFVDRRESLLKEAGDYIIPGQKGAIGPDHIRAEIGDVLAGIRPGRTSDGEITLFKSLGMAVEDLASAEYLYRKAVETKKGKWVEF